MGLVKASSEKTRQPTAPPDRPGPAARAKPKIAAVPTAQPRPAPARGFRRRTPAFAGRAAAGRARRIPPPERPRRRSRSPACARSLWRRARPRRGRRGRGTARSPRSREAAASPPRRCRTGPRLANLLPPRPRATGRQAAAASTTSPRARRGALDARATRPPSWRAASRRSRRPVPRGTGPATSAPSTQAAREPTAPPQLRSAAASRSRSAPTRARPRPSDSSPPCASAPARLLARGSPVTLQVQQGQKVVLSRALCRLRCARRPPRPAPSSSASRSTAWW